MSGSGMREALQARYQSRYDIPTEQSISSFLSCQVRKHNKSTDVSSDGIDSTSYSRKRIPLESALLFVALKQRSGTRRDIVWYWTKQESAFI